MDKGQIGRHTAVVLLANFGSMLLGLLATILVAQYFGSGPSVDAFFVALAVPQVVGQILLSVALISIVPGYLQTKTDSGLAAAQESVAPLFYASAVALSGLGLLLALLAPFTVRLLAPGFEGESFATAVRLLRWLSPLLPLLGLSGILQGIENANHQFALAAWAKPLLSLAALGALLGFATGYGIRAYAWGMLAGGVAGFTWQFQEVYAHGGFVPRLSGWREALRKFRRAFGAILVARVLGQAGVLVTSMVASTVAVGTVSALGYALKIASVPFLASASFGIVLFPALAKARADADGARQLRLLWRSVRAMAALGLAVAIPMFIWAEQIVQVLFERGAFTPAGTAEAAVALRVYALGIAFVAANTNIGNAFWAQGWYRVRLVLETVALGLLVALSVAVAPVWGAAGLAGALVVEFVFLTAAGLYLVERRTPAGDLHAHLAVIGKLVVVACGVGLIMMLVLPGVETFREWSLLERLGALAGAGGLSVVLFAFAGFVWAIPEIDDTIALLVGSLTPRGRALDADQRNLLPLRIRRKLRDLVSRWLPRRKRRPTAAADIEKILSESRARASLIDDFRSGPLPPGAGPVDEHSPFLAEAQVAVERAVHREVDLLGSGPIRLGRPIKWHCDYVSGYTWPAVHHSRLSVVQAGRDVDCKFPWEVARCQQWGWLARGAKLNDRAFSELISQFQEFVTANPPGVGITYGNAMEVALRAVNWIGAFRTLADRVPDRELHHLAVELHEAGRFIFRHLESTERGLNSNHYIANLVGLYAIATLFPSLPDSPEWYRFAGDELTEELACQFDPSGMHREGSPAYARLVLEMYLYVLLLGRRANDPRVEDWCPALESGLDWLATLIYPDGTLPHLGDDDAGRVLAPPGEAVNDYRYLIQIGAVVFERADWKGRVGELVRPGLEFWLGSDGVKRYTSMAQIPDRELERVFEPGGVAVYRTPDVVLTVQGGRTETRAPRGHLHNDLTGFEYFADGICWAIDPGAYQYTRQPMWRNRFRATSAHSVIQIDDREQNSWRPDWLFYLSREAEPLPVVSEEGRIRVGYRMPADAPYASVERIYEVESAGRLVRVTDRVEGAGNHLVTLGLNIARMPFTYLKRDLMLFRSAAGDFLLYVPTPEGFLNAVKDGWCSPRFGVRDRCFRFESSGQVKLPFEVQWGFAAVPKGDDAFEWARRLGCDLDAYRAEVRG